MLHLITSNNRSLYEREIAALHRARKAVFVDELGWKLRVDNGLEIDEYNDARAMHVVGFDALENVAMAIRIRPADDRSMLRDHFSHHLTPAIRPFDDGKTWEVSRGFCRERGLGRGAMVRKAACMIAPLEIALAAGINRYIGFTDVRMLGLYYHVGWKLQLMGDPMPYGEGDGVAYEAEVSESVIADIRRNWGIPAPAALHIQQLEPGLTVHQQAAKAIAQDPARANLVAPAPVLAAAARPGIGRAAAGALARGPLIAQPASANTEQPPARTTKAQ